jgi:hypothetical protein
MGTTLPVRLEATIVDELNVVAETSAYALVDPSASFSDVLTVFNSWLADLDACTDGQILAAELEVTPSLPEGLKSAAVGGSRCEQTGVLDFLATGDTHKWGFPIPALANNANVISAGKVVISAGKPVNTFFSLLLGGGSAALTWTNATQQALASLSSAFLSFRQHNRQMARYTYERA